MQMQETSLNDGFKCRLQKSAKAQSTTEVTSTALRDIA
jgi:hypothetical protein